VFKLFNELEFIGLVSPLPVRERVSAKQTGEGGCKKISNCFYYLFIPLIRPIGHLLPQGEKEVAIDDNDYNEIN
jgi:hypothetical protein